MPHKSYVFRKKLHGKANGRCVNMFASCVVFQWIVQLYLNYIANNKILSRATEWVSYAVFCCLVPFPFAFLSIPYKISTKSCLGVNGNPKKSAGLTVLILLLDHFPLILA
ncbi:hypothetical protein F5Y07DRAFT_49135 [Xylaria sp. FL0933]|nr:hypothetical protein F5Y07DRAFT_49135 [Xylaria sp. FL0933]